MANAVFSPCLKYRYVLRRNLSEDTRTCLFIMLNPSTADEVQDDPTVRRCIGYAKKWGYGKLIVCNIFAYRSTDPKALKEINNPIGLENLRYIQEAVRETIRTNGIVVCAWGTHGEYMGQGTRIIRAVRETGARPFCLKWTKTKQPAHPLYLKATLNLKEIVEAV